MLASLLDDGTAVASSDASSLSNADIAMRFQRIADALEVSGENPFKIKAYRRAVETILDLEDDLRDIDARGALGQIDGFGPAIVGKTRDFLATGTTKLYDEVTATVPLGVIDMASIGGVGPKTAKALWEALGVTSVDGLESAAREQRVRNVAGFGAAKEAKIIETIERWRRLTARTPRYVALPTAQWFARTLGAGRVEIAGELRRGCDTVSQIEIVTDGAMPTPESTASPEISVMQSPASAWGTTLVHATGPREHLAQLAVRAEAKGVTLNRQAPFAEEADLYGALGLPFIAPELRDWPDIVERAEQGRLPPLITEADFRGQLHEHSTYSDGSATVRQMAEAAQARGYEYLAITDHSRSLQVANGLSRERLLGQLEEIAALNQEFAGRFTLLTGIEADVLADGSLDCDPDVLARLDVVVGSVHIRHREDQEQMTRRIVTALENPYLTLLGHPTGRLLGRREPYPVDMDRVIETAATHRKTLEINAAPERMDLNDEYTRRAKDAGVKLTINADAHSTAGLGLLPWGLCMARRAGLEAGDVINTYPLERLRAEVLRPR